jgi:hypothetical protein
MLIEEERQDMEIWMILRQDTGAQDSFFADMPRTITGRNPKSGKTETETETVSHMTHFCFLE